MLITNQNIVEKNLISSLNTKVRAHILKIQSLLFFVVHNMVFLFIKKVAQNKVRNVIHISTPLIVVTSI